MPTRLVKGLPRVPKGTKLLLIKGSKAGRYHVQRLRVVSPKRGFGLR